MKIDYTVQAGNETLLMYFTGWGTTPEVAQHLVLSPDWDYFTAYDYRVIQADNLPDFKSYKHVYLAAWSMGVWAADVLAPFLPTPEIAVAINGTPIPMHDQYGIPDQIFEGTLRGLDDENRERFNRRMCGGKKLLAVYNSFSARSTEDLREELTGVYQQVRGLSGEDKPNQLWSKALVSERDLIVPSANQTAYWQKHNVAIELLKGAGHYPLMEYNRWKELLGL